MSRSSLANLLWRLGGGFRQDLGHGGVPGEMDCPSPALAQGVDLHLVTHGGWVLGDAATLCEQLWTPSGPSNHSPAHSASQTGCSGDGDAQLQRMQPVGREGHQPVCPQGSQRQLVPGEMDGEWWQERLSSALGDALRRGGALCSCQNPCSSPAQQTSCCCGMGGSGPAAWLLCPWAVPSARGEPEPVFCFPGKWTLWFASPRLSSWCQL